jgi:hypothetical protein
VQPARIRAPMIDVVNLALVMWLVKNDLVPQVLFW